MQCKGKEKRKGEKKRMKNAGKKKREEKRRESRCSAMYGKLILSGTLIEKKRMREKKKAGNPAGLRSSSLHDFYYFYFCFHFFIMPGT